MCTELHPALLQCQLIVSEMQHFVQQIQYYINFEVQLRPFVNFELFYCSRFVQSIVCLFLYLLTHKGVFSDFPLVILETSANS